MTYRRSLRFRVCLAFTLLGALLAGVFAAATWITSERMEAAFVQTTLVEGLEYFVAEWRRDPSTQPPDTASVRGHVAPLEDLSRVPEPLRALEPGVREIELDGGRELEVAVRDDGGHRFYLLYDEAHIEAAEAELLRLLSVSAVLAVGLSLWIGWVAARRVTAPAGTLARQVGDLDVRAPETSLAETFQGDDEVRVLARAFDDTFRRMRELVERERAFTADASHQLRTSAAVIGSTVEVLLGDPELPQASRVRLERLARAASHLNRQIEGFLFLAREPETDAPPVSVAETLRRIVEDERAFAGDTDRPIELRVEADARVRAPAAAFDIVLGNLLRNALVHGSGPVTVEVDGTGVTVRDQGAGVPDEVLARAFERGYQGDSGRAGDGLGLAIARRVCERHGWGLELDSAPGRGTVCRVGFGGS